MNVATESSVESYPQLRFMNSTFCRELTCVDRGISNFRTDSFLKQLKRKNRDKNHAKLRRRVDDE